MVADHIDRSTERPSHRSATHGQARVTPRSIAGVSGRWSTGAASRYAAAVGIVLIAIALKALLPGLGVLHPFALLPGAVALAAWYGGRGPGLLATALVGLASLYLFVPPGGFAEILPQIVGVGGLVVESVLIATLASQVRSSLDQARAASAASATAHREAEFALAVRDELLLLWTTQLRGPMADVEAAARTALADLEGAGYTGNATEQLRELVATSERVGRTTAGWDQRGRLPDEVPRAP